eukprot:gene2842-3640_t
MPDYEGYLHKQGRILGNWKFRYAVLQGTKLTYFTDASKRNCTSVVDVRTAHEWTDGKREHTFGFTTIERKVYKCFTNTELEKNEWVTALNASCAESAVAEAQSKALSPRRSFPALKACCADKVPEEEHSDSAESEVLLPSPSEDKEPSEEITVRKVYSLEEAFDGLRALHRLSFVERAEACRDILMQLDRCGVPGARGGGGASSRALLQVGQDLGSAAPDPQKMADAMELCLKGALRFVEVPATRFPAVLVLLRLAARLTGGIYHATCCDAVGPREPPEMELEARKETWQRMCKRLRAALRARPGGSPIVLLELPLSCVELGMLSLGSHRFLHDLAVGSAKLLSGGWRADVSTLLQGLCIAGRAMEGKVRELAARHAYHEIYLLGADKFSASDTDAPQCHVAEVASLLQGPNSCEGVKSYLMQEQSRLLEGGPRWEVIAAWVHLLFDLLEAQELPPAFGLWLWRGNDRFKGLSSYLELGDPHLPPGEVGGPLKADGGPSESAGGLAAWLENLPSQPDEDWLKQGVRRLDAYLQSVVSEVQEFSDHTGLERVKEALQEVQRLWGSVGAFNLGATHERTCQLLEGIGAVLEQAKEGLEQSQEASTRMQEGLARVEEVLSALAPDEGTTEEVEEEVKADLERQLLGLTDKIARTLQDGTSRAHGPQAAATAGSASEPGRANLAAPPSSLPLLCEVFAQHVVTRLRTLADGHASEALQAEKAAEWSHQVGELMRATATFVHVELQLRAIHLDPLPGGEAGAPQAPTAAGAQQVASCSEPLGLPAEGAVPAPRGSAPIAKLGDAQTPDDEVRLRVEAAEVADTAEHTAHHEGAGSQTVAPIMGSGNAWHVYQARLSGVMERHTPRIERMREAHEAGSGKVQAQIKVYIWELQSELERFSSAGVMLDATAVPVVSRGKSQEGEEEKDAAAMESADRIPALRRVLHFIRRSRDASDRVAEALARRLESMQEAKEQHAEMVQWVESAWTQLESLTDSAEVTRVCSGLKQKVDGWKDEWQHRTEHTAKAGRVLWGSVTRAAHAAIPVPAPLGAALQSSAPLGGLPQDLRVQMQEGARQLLLDSKEWAAAAQDSAESVLDTVEEIAGEFGTVALPVFNLWQDWRSHQAARRELWRVRAHAAYRTMLLLNAWELREKTDADEAGAGGLPAAAPVGVQAPALRLDGLAAAAAREDEEAAAVEEKEQGWQMLRRELARAMTRRTALETTAAARKVLLSNEMVKDAAWLLREGLVDHEAELQRELQERLGRLEALTQQQWGPGGEHTGLQRAAVLAACTRERLLLQRIMVNVQDVGRSMQVVLAFVGQMQAQLLTIEAKLDEALGALHALQAVQQRQEERLMRIEMMNGGEVLTKIRVKLGGQECPLWPTEVYIEPRAREVGPAGEAVEPPCPIEAVTTAFLEASGLEECEGGGKTDGVANNMEGASVLLISGWSGSGKSTVAARLRYRLGRGFLEQDAQAGAGGRRLLGVYANLPAMANPRTDLMREALQKQYDISPQDVAELKRCVQEGEVEIVLVLDGYDELAPGMQHLNLYDTNDLETWRRRDAHIGPRIIVLCRAEFLSGCATLGQYRRLFAPKESENDTWSQDENAARRLTEWRLDDFQDASWAQFIFFHIALQLRAELCKWPSTAGMNQPFAHLPDAVLDQGDLFGSWGASFGGWTVHQGNSGLRAHELVKQQLRYLYKASMRTPSAHDAATQLEAQWRLAEAVGKVTATRGVEEKHVVELAHTFYGHMGWTLPGLKEWRDSGAELRVWGFEKFLWRLTSKMGEFHDLMKTPHMMTIIVNVLPSVEHLSSSEEQVKDRVLTAFGDEVGERVWVALRRKKGAAHGSLMQLHVLRKLQEALEPRLEPQPSGASLGAAVGRGAADAWAETAYESKLVAQLEEVLASDELKGIFGPSGAPAGGPAEGGCSWSLESAQAGIRRCLMAQPVQRSKLFELFINLQVDRGCEKLEAVQVQGLGLEELRRNAFAFMRQLAAQMTAQNSPKVRYLAQLAVESLRGSPSEWDRFFAPESVRLASVRQVVPLKQAGDVFAFQHKSLQEFMVSVGIAEDLVEAVEGMELSKQELRQTIKEVGPRAAGNAPPLPAGGDGAVGRLPSWPPQHRALLNDELEPYFLEVLLWQAEKLPGGGAGGSAGVSAIGDLSDPERMRRAKRLTALAVKLRSCPLNSVSMTREEAVMDFMADRWLTDAKAAGALEVWILLCTCWPAWLHGALLASRNLQTLLELRMPRRGGGTMLHAAAREGNLHVLGLLLELAQSLSHGDEATRLEWLNARDRQRRTPLYLAVEQGHLEALELLVRSGADFGLSATEPVTLEVLRGGAGRASVDPLARTVHIPRSEALQEESVARTGGFRLSLAYSGGFVAGFPAVAVSRGRWMYEVTVENDADAARQSADACSGPEVEPVEKWVEERVKKEWLDFNREEGHQLVATTEDPQKRLRHGPISEHGVYVCTNPAACGSSTGAKCAPEEEGKEAPSIYCRVHPWFSIGWASSGMASDLEKRGRDAVMVDSDHVGCNKASVGLGGNGSWQHGGAPEMPFAAMQDIARDEAAALAAVANLQEGRPASHRRHDGAADEGEARWWNSVRWWRGPTMTRRPKTQQPIREKQDSGSRADIEADRECASGVHESAALRSFWEGQRHKLPSQLPLFYVRRGAEMGSAREERLCTHYAIHEEEGGQQLAGALWRNACAGKDLPPSRMLFEGPVHESRAGRKKTVLTVAVDLEAQPAAVWFGLGAEWRRVEWASQDLPCAELFNGGAVFPLVSCSDLGYKFSFNLGETAFQHPQPGFQPYALAAVGTLSRDTWFAAAQNGHLAVCERLLMLKIARAAQVGDKRLHQISLNAADIHGRTLAHYGAEHNGVRFLCKLLEIDEAHGDPKAPLSWHQKDKQGHTPLHMACAGGARDAAFYLLEKLPSSAVEAVDAQGNTPMHHLASGGHTEIMAWLLCKNAGAVTHTNFAGMSPLHVAAKKQHEATARQILTALAGLPGSSGFWPHEVVDAGSRGEGADADGDVRNADAAMERLLAAVDAKDMDGNTPLYYAAGTLSGARLVKALEQAGADLNAANNIGKSALMLAAEHGNADVVGALWRADCGQADHKGRTAVHWAAEGGSAQVLEALVNQEGAHTARRDKDGKTPVYLAAEGAREEALEKLKEADAEPRHLVIISSGITPAHRAAGEGQVEEARVDLNRSDADGKSPAYDTVWNGHAEALRALKQAGADLAPLADIFAHWAAERGEVQVLQMLRAVGLDLGWVDYHGRTPAHCAASWGQAEALKILGDAGVNLAQADALGATPAQVAREGGHAAALGVLTGNQRALGSVRRAARLGGNSLRERRDSKAATHAPLLQGGRAAEAGNLPSGNAAQSPLAELDSQLLTPDQRRLVVWSGVSLAFLQRFERQLRERFPGRSLSTRQVVAEVVKERTRREGVDGGGVRYIDLPEMFGEVGPSKFFVSHMWGADFAKLVARLGERLDDADPERVHVWIDVFAVNQHGGTAADLERLQDCLRASEAGTLLVMDELRVPGDDGSVIDLVPLKRLWCVYEMWSTLHLRGERWLQVEEGSMARSAWQRSVDGLDVAQCEAYSESDKRMMLEQVQATVGVQALNHRVRALFILVPLFYADDMRLLQEGEDTLELGLLDTWLEDPGRAGKTLWIQGVAGGGKSTVSSAIIRRHCAEGQEGRAPPCALLHLFVKHNDLRKQSPIRAVRTLAHQLFMAFPALLGEYFCGLGAARVHELRSPEDAVQLLLREPIERYLQGRRVVIVVDALDEGVSIAEERLTWIQRCWQNRMARLVCLHLRKLPEGVSLVVTSRSPFPGSGYDYLEHMMTSHAEEAVTRGSLEAFIRPEDAHATMKRALVEKHPTEEMNVDAVITEVKRLSKGTMVYCRVLRELVERAKGGGDIVASGRLPASLDMAYRAYMKALQEDLGREGCAQVVELVRVLAAAREPLSISQLLRCGFADAAELVQRVGFLFRVSEDFKVLAFHKTEMRRKGPPPSGRLLYRSSERWADELMSIHHDGQVHAVALSADGKMVASGASDKIVRLYDSSTGELKMELRGHGQLVSAVAFSADDTTVVSASCDKSVRLWDAATGEPKKLLTVPKAPAEAKGQGWNLNFNFEFEFDWTFIQGDWRPAVALSADGNVVATGSQNGKKDNAVRLWDVHTGTLRAVLQGHDGMVHSVMISADGRMVASASGDATVRLWDAATGEPTAVMNGHDDVVCSVAISADCKTVASGSLDATVRLWEAATKELRACFRHSSPVTSVAISADGKTVAATTLEMVCLWDATTGDPKAELCHPGGIYSSVALNAKGTMVVSGSLDMTVQLWDASIEGHKGELPPHGPGGKEFGSEFPERRHGPVDGMSSMAFSADGKTVATGGTAMVQLRDACTGELKAELKAETEADMKTPLKGRLKGNLASNPTLQHSAIQGREETGEKHPDSDADSEAESSGVVSYISVAFSIDSKMVASGSSDRMVRLWDASTGDLQMVLQGHEGKVTSVAFSPDGKTVASGSSDGMTRLWDASTGDLKTVLQDPEAEVTSVAFSPDGKTVATSSSFDYVYLWDLDTGEEKASMDHDVPVQSVTFSADGATIASGSGDCTVQLWDASGGGKKAELKGHCQTVMSVAFSPDGKMVASGSLDGTVRLWDTCTLEQHAVLWGHRSFVHSVAFSPDGKTLASGSVDGTVRVWDVPVGE